MKSCEIGLVIFDLDGTLYKIPRDFDKDVSAEICSFYKKCFGLKTYEEVCEKLKELKDKFGSNPLAFHRMGKSESFYREVYSKVEPADYLRTDPKLVDFLNGLSVGKAVFTNGPKFFADKVMQRLGIFEIVEYVEYGNTCEPKPSTEGFKKILGHFNLKPEQCMMVGDTPSEDLMPAKKLGMKTAYVTNGEKYLIDSTIIDCYISDVYSLEAIL